MKFWEMSIMGKNLKGRNQRKQSDLPKTILKLQILSIQTRAPRKRRKCGAKMSLHKNHKKRRDLLSSECKNHKTWKKKSKRLWNFHRIAMLELTSIWSIHLISGNWWERMGKKIHYREIKKLNGRKKVQGQNRKKEIAGSELRQ